MQVVENYVAAWNAKTSEERQSLLATCMTADVVYIDPHLPDPIQGIEEMQALIERFRGRFDHNLEPEGKIDTHHHVFRLRWKLERDNGEMLSCGLMVGDLSADGIIERVVHFIDPAPPA
jgi:hypothetical protein